MHNTKQVGIQTGHLSPTQFFSTSSGFLLHCSSTSLIGPRILQKLYGEFEFITNT